MTTYVVHLANEDRLTRACDGRRWRPAPEGPGVRLRLCDGCRRAALDPVHAPAPSVVFDDYHPWEPAPGRVSPGSGSMREAVWLGAAFGATAGLVLGLVATAMRSPWPLAVVLLAAAVAVALVSLRRLR